MRKVLCSFLSNALYLNQLVRGLLINLDWVAFTRQKQVLKRSLFAMILYCEHVFEAVAAKQLINQSFLRIRMVEVILC